MEDIEKRRANRRRSSSKWRALHPERAKEKARAYYAKHADTNRKKAVAKYWANREHRIAHQKERYREYRSEILEQARRRGEKIKKRVYDHYGHACVCCGETVPQFLTIDHKNGVTREQRRKEGTGSNLYSYIIKQSFPDDFRVLCYNCNLGREVNGGICPHKRKIDEAAA